MQVAAQIFETIGVRGRHLQHIRFLFELHFVPHQQLLRWIWISSAIVLHPADLLLHGSSRPNAARTFARRDLEVRMAQAPACGPKRLAQLYDKSSGPVRHQSGVHRNHRPGAFHQSEWEHSIWIISFSCNSQITNAIYSYFMVMWNMINAWTPSISRGIMRLKLLATNYLVSNAAQCWEIMIWIEMEFAFGVYWCLLVSLNGNHIKIKNKKTSLKHEQNEIAFKNSSKCEEIDTTAVVLCWFAQ